MLSLFEKKYIHVGIDIGASAIKLARLAAKVDHGYSLEDFALFPLEGGVFSQNMLTKSSKVVDTLREMAELHALKDTRIVTTIPASSVFTKKHKFPVMELEELREHLHFEAPSLIPHGSDGVYLDFHVLGKSGKNHVEVLVVAVKREIVDRLVEVFASAGLKVGVVDVDQFATQNAFEFNNPATLNTTQAVVNIGSRYTGISICRDGHCLFAGDISIGGKQLADRIAQELNVTQQEAESIQFSQDEGTAKTCEIMDDFVQKTSSELGRQLSYFWNASGAEGSIDGVVLTGGSAQIRGLRQAIEEELKTECAILDPFERVQISNSVDRNELALVGYRLAVAVGLGMRSIGDRV
jgi:type IV pilus assembly protein PilM